MCVVSSEHYRNAGREVSDIAGCKIGQFIGPPCCCAMLY